MIRHADFFDRILLTASHCPALYRPTSRFPHRNSPQFYRKIRHMLIASWLSSLQSKLQGRSRTATRRSRKLSASRHISAESLEGRQLLTVTFSSPMQFAGSGQNTVAYDFNHDQKTDIATFGGRGVEVLLSNGNGTFQAAVRYGSNVQGPGLALGDFNVDGKIDVVQTNVLTPAVVSVALGNGDGTFQSSLKSTGVWQYSYFDAVAAADFNGDGFPDIVTTSGLNNSLTVMRGFGNGLFDTSTQLNFSGISGPITVGDFDGNGTADIAAANGGLWVLLGNGSGTFVAPTNFAAGTGITAYNVVAGDFNSDGKLDLATSNENAASGTNNVSLFLNNGNGTFQFSSSYAIVGRQTGRGLQVGDFNGDGKLDLVTANRASGTVTVLENNGNGGFAGAVNFSLLGGISTPQYLAVGDFNGDGKSDLITSNDNNQGKFVLLNTSPTFNAPPVVAANVAAVSANEGGTVLNTGTFNDAQGRNTVNITASIGNVTQDNIAGTWSWSLNVADGPASGNVTITARDNQNAAANTTFAYSVNNVAPTISLNGNATVYEGSQYTLNLGAVTDPGTDTITSYRINWGDGTNSGLIVGNPANTSATHTFADGPSTQTNNVTVTDEDGNFLAGSLSVLVLNVAPTIALTGAQSVNEGSSYTLNLGAITDPGTDTASAYSINWGDGSAVENFSGSPADISKTHTYVEGSDYFTISVSLTDEDGIYEMPDCWM